nr:MAG TPA: hypothetical protein [Caudoviricetes sp.]
MGLILGSGSTKPQYPYDQWYGVQGDTTSSDYKLNGFNFRQWLY